jgi:hypothetical protein
VFAVVMEDLGETARPQLTAPPLSAVTDLACGHALGPGLVAIERALAPLPLDGAPQPAESVYEAHGGCPTVKRAMAPGGVLLRVVIRGPQLYRSLILPFDTSSTACRM